MIDEPKEEPKLHRIQSDMGIGTEILSGVATDQPLPIEIFQNVWREVWLKNWWLIGLYIFVSFVVEPFLTAFIEGWPSVTVTVFLNIMTSIIGFFALVRTAQVVTLVLTNKPTKFFQWRGWRGRKWLSHTN